MLMRTRITVWLPAMVAAAVLVVGLTGSFRAQEGDDHHAAHDKLLRKGLLDAMRRGVYLYNEQRDVVGCSRVFEGALISVKPLLHHHKELQKKIDDALAGIEQPAGWERAFALRAVLDEVADRLGGKAAKDKDGTKDTTLKDKDKDKTDKDKTDKDKVTGDKTDKAAKTDKTDKDKTDKDKADKDKADKPKKDAAAKDLPVRDTSVKDKKDAPAKDGAAKDKQPPPDAGSVRGKVTYQGKPLSIGFVTFVSDKDNRTFSANIQPDGTYALNKGIPVGKYKVVIEKSPSPPDKNQKVVAIPDRFQAAATTPLVVTVNRGQNNLDLQLGD